MNHRRHHHGLPSGRAEVELFSAWERELTDDVPGAGAPTAPGERTWRPPTTMRCRR